MKRAAKKRSMKEAARKRPSLHMSGMPVINRAESDYHAPFQVRSGSMLLLISPISCPAGDEYIMRLWPREGYSASISMDKSKARAEWVIAPEEM